MFPWVDGFHWTFGHILFLTLFGLVLVTVGATVLTAMVRTVLSMRRQRAEAISWHADFNELAASERVCRHQLTGEIEHRECPNGFDCRRCEKHPTFATSKASTDDELFGLSYPANRYYHRGHTWVEVCGDGTLKVGLDEIGKRLMGMPDTVTLPAVGARVQAFGTGWEMSKDGHPVRILAPVDGIVVETGLPEDGWYLRLKLVTDQPDLRHLLHGVEVRAWVGAELERLHLLFAPAGAAAAFADGGVLMHDLISQQPVDRWDAIFGEVFLEP